MMVRERQPRRGNMRASVVSRSAAQPASEHTHRQAHDHQREHREADRDVDSPEERVARLGRVPLLTQATTTASTVSQCRTRKGEAWRAMAGIPG